MCDRCVEWHGIVFHVYKRGYYETLVRLHRLVWEEAHGPIPNGHHIHHKSGDKTDNRLENLELLSHGEHSAEHFQKNILPHRARALRNSLLSRERNATKRMLRDIVCARCSAVFHSGSTFPAKYCSSRCIQAARSGAFEGETRKCAFCAETYSAERRVQLFCSKKCNNRAAAARAPSSVAREVSCAKCGACFTSSRSNARFCCRKCALDFHVFGRVRKPIGRVA